MSACRIWVSIEEKTGSGSQLALSDSSGSKTLYFPVLRIHDILVLIRIWIPGPIPMDSDADPDPAIFVIDLHDLNKQKISLKVFLLLTF